MSHGGCRHRILDARLHNDNANSAKHLDPVERITVLGVFSPMIAVRLESLSRRQLY
jgi:hypothetical protein